MINGVRAQAKQNGISGDASNVSTADEDTASSEEIHKLKREITDLQRKMGQMKRNYDSLSHYSASDKAEFTKLKNAKEAYEAAVKKLEAENAFLTTETGD